MVWQVNCLTKTAYENIIAPLMSDKFKTFLYFYFTLNSLRLTHAIMNSVTWLSGRNCDDRFGSIQDMERLSGRETADVSE